ncbi:hypothetical protein [Evansella cellulosilytica]|uniref:Uncharacterized protein n=1 Tax=Evansella cellulosilytica (strain ATCC 21833 / DSM 2522 / FERM P-1141 / JCM 9156 / N-4) TaxID=649639 RepID=E6U1K2_EVAC2|nr:hypothetical protein [Evansella cellulosilytica]ADU30365.1 hypothetical protein Bcell_2104 [Evansella cellulosilytica DSM 2522]
MNNTILKSNKNTYFVKYPINAHCEAEEILGYPITQLNDKNAGMFTFRTLMYVGLKYAGKVVPMEQAGDIMQEVIADKGMEYFTNEISKAISKSLTQQNNNTYKHNNGKKR